MTNEFYKIGHSLLPKKIVDEDKNPNKNLVDDIYEGKSTPQNIQTID